MAVEITDGLGMLGTGLQNLLLADAIQPGHAPSYQLCKVIYSYHPHGAKIVDFPLQMAMFKPRKITIPKTPDDGEMIVQAFMREWKGLHSDRHIMNTARLGRIYGVSTLGLMIADDETENEVNFDTLDKATISFNVWDPLNTAGSLVLNQDPNAMDFQKIKGVRVSGTAYHRSRTCSIMNEEPLYIEYESAGFGFLGRSIYQRALVAMKSFVLTLATDMMIALKAGVIVAKMETQSSAVDGPQSWLFGTKRSIVKEAQIGNVISIGTGEDIESLNLQNLDGAYGMARSNIIENEAAASGTPAKILLAETFAEGFGEGTEDAKHIAMFIEGIREWMQPLYDFMDNIVMHRAWSRDFYENVKAKYPDAYANRSYESAIQEWRNSFNAEWPSLLDEPESEKAKTEDVKLKAIIAVVEVLMPEIPPSEKASVIQWCADNLNENKRLFSSPLVLDYEAIADYEPPNPLQEQEPPEPESARDSQRGGKRVRERIERADDELRRNALKLVIGQAVGDGAAV